MKRPYTQTKSDIDRLNIGNGITTADELMFAAPWLKGVYSSDEFARNYHRFKAGDSMIVNLDAGWRRGGTHWIPVKISDDDGFVLYKDSFGYPPPTNICIAVSEGHPRRKLLYSDSKLQRVKEENCGQRAILILKKMNDSPDDIGTFRQMN